MTGRDGVLRIFALANATNTVQAAVRARSRGTHAARRVALITHVIDQANAGNMDAALAALSEDERRRLIDSFGDLADPVVYLEQEIESAAGERIQVEVYGIMRTTDFFEVSLRRRDYAALEEVRSAVIFARQGRRSCALARSDSTRDIVSSNGLLVSQYGPSVTTGQQSHRGCWRSRRCAVRYASAVAELAECRVGGGCRGQHLQCAGAARRRSCSRDDADPPSRR